jgi:excisionase family DNA binding protein
MKLSVDNPWNGKDAMITKDSTTSRSRLSQPAPIFLTVSEAARLLRITTRSIYQMVAESRIPYRRVGRAVRFEQTELMEWTKAHANGQTG